MISIQEAVTQIYSDNPKNLYFFTGPDYGVKKSYIDELAKKYGGCVEEYSSMQDLIGFLRTKTLLPKSPKLYIVRYDKSFLSSLDETILKLKIPGTVVCIYQDDSDETKLDKVFPGNVLRVNNLPPQVIYKHLHSEYPSIPERLLKYVANFNLDYYKCKIICENLSYLNDNTLHALTKSDLEFLFGYKLSSNSEKFKKDIASKDFFALCRDIDSYEGDMNLLFYDILATCLEIVKVMNKPYSDSFVSPYVKKWSIENVLAFYNIVFDQIDKLRNYSNYSTYNSLIYICSLLNYNLS